MKEVRIGIIGYGNIGGQHTRNLLGGKIRRARLAAVADINPARLALITDPSVRLFATGQEMIDSGEVDAVQVCTPHYDHPVSGIAVLKAGLHLLMEKPLAVHPNDALRLLAAHTNPKQVFSAMFNQRTNPLYCRVKDLIAKGELGNLLRINWIITDWFRSDYYYRSGGWRATWGGEGGGVLLNQCPHQLDLLQWICGMPSRVRAFCHLGKYHDIEVEDEVTAYLEYPNGATGVFVTSTGETPGTNRFEVAGERGKIVIEKNNLIFVRNEVEASEFRRKSKGLWDKPPVWNIEIPSQSNEPTMHAELLQNFVDAILDGTPLLAPAKEGIKGVELACSMIYSSMTGKVAELPLDADKYERMLKKLVRESTRENTMGGNGSGKGKGKGSESAAVVDMSKSY